MFGVKPKENQNTTPETPGVLNTPAQPSTPTNGPTSSPAIQPALPKKQGLIAQLTGLIFRKKEASSSGAPFKPVIDPETGGVRHDKVEKQFKRMNFLQRYSYRGVKTMFVIFGILFFIVAFYLGYLAVRAVLPPADLDNDGVADTVDKCPGKDDTIDQDKDGIPDACDEAITPADFSDITFTEPTLVTSDDKVYDVVFVVTDANKTWGVTNLKYKVEVLSAKGDVLKSQMNTTYVNPASSTTIIEPNITTSEKVSSVKVTLISGDFAAAASTQNITLNIRDKNFTPRTADGTALFSGVLQNNSNFDLNIVNVTMVVKSATGSIVADNLAKINTVVAGENRYFELRFPQSLDPSVTYEVLAVTNGMNAGNLIPKQGTGTQF